MPCVAFLLASQKRNWLGAPSPIDRCRSRTRLSAISKPSLFTLPECRPVRLLTEQTEDRRGFHIDASIRSQDGPFQAALDLDRGFWMVGTWQRRPRLPNYGRATRASSQRDKGSRSRETKHQREPHESDARALSRAARPFSGDTAAHWRRSAPCARAVTNGAFRACADYARPRVRRSTSVMTAAAASRTLTDKAGVAERSRSSTTPARRKMSVTTSATRALRVWTWRGMS
jgi:hypothetical protein